jgi:hypothetical protein
MQSSRRTFSICTNDYNGSGYFPRTDVRPSFTKMSPAAALTRMQRRAADERQRTVLPPSNCGRRPECIFSSGVNRTNPAGFIGSTPFMRTNSRFLGLRPRERPLLILYCPRIGSNGKFVETAVPETKFTWNGFPPPTGPKCPERIRRELLSRKVSSGVQNRLE